MGPAAERFGASDRANCSRELAHFRLLAGLPGSEVLPAQGSSPSGKKGESGFLRVVNRIRVAGPIRKNRWAQRSRILQWKD
jgi:hypothetical protein